MPEFYKIREEKMSNDQKDILEKYWLRVNPICRKVVYRVGTMSISSMSMICLDKYKKCSLKSLQTDICKLEMS